MDKAIRQLGLVIALSFGLAISASGQGRGFSAPMRGFSAPMRGFSAPMRGSSGISRGISGPRRANGFRRGFFFPPVVATPLNPSFIPINGVPGLGFDFPHLAAVSRGFPQSFVFTNNGFFPFFTPIFFDSLPLSEAAGIADEGGQQPIFVMTPPPQPQPSAPPAETAPRQSATPQAPPPPPPELGQLILVRSDGQVLLAVAFTVRNGQLTYITNEGTRRSFPVSELDKDATRQMNDANGTLVSLPN